MISIVQQASIFVVVVGCAVTDKNNRRLSSKMGYQRLDSVLKTNWGRSQYIVKLFVQEAPSRKVSWCPGCDVRELR